MLRSEYKLHTLRFWEFDSAKQLGKGREGKGREYLSDARRRRRPRAAALALSPSPLVRKERVGGEVVVRRNKEDGALSSRIGHPEFGPAVEPRLSPTSDGPYSKTFGPFSDSARAHSPHAAPFQISKRKRLLYPSHLSLSPIAQGFRQGRRRRPAAHSSFLSHPSRRE